MSVNAIPGPALYRALADFLLGVAITGGVGVVLLLLAWSQS